MHTSAFLPAGIDNEAAIKRISCTKAGMLTNDAALNMAGMASRQALLQMGVPLVRLFAPEHGLHRQGEDGAAMPDDLDTLTGLPVYSLYGEQWAPTPAMLNGLDVVFFDVPDVGSRFYTYLWSLTHLMEACAGAGVRVVVLDRPNPIGCLLHQAEGPLLDEEKCSSYIGRWRIPVRHSCTLGELALYFNFHKIPQLWLEVITCPGYTRVQHYLSPSLSFTPTSPAIAHAHTALLYAGTCLLEGINVNEGRGTSCPFEQAGAPWLEAEPIVKQLYKQGWDKTISLNPVQYVPAWGMYANVPCHGIRMQIIDFVHFRPMAFGIALLQAIISRYPMQAVQRLYPTVANPSGGGHLDRLLGIAGSYQLLAAQMPLPTDVSPFWEKEIHDFLLYE